MIEDFTSTSVRLRWNTTDAADQAVTVQGPTQTVWEAFFMPSNFSAHGTRFFSKWIAS